MQKYVAYYRVSTQKQGQSGLGLDSQRRTVENYCQDGQIIAEFTDIESGTKSKRPELAKALALTKAEHAILIIAKLDRLSRNVHFTTFLMQSKVRFKACDMPQADEFTINIFSALAQQEAKLISQRTRSALEMKKERIARGDYTNASGKQAMKPDVNGTYRLGNPKGMPAHVRLKGNESRRLKASQNESNTRAVRIIRLLREQKLTFEQIAKELNDSGFRTTTGKEFRPTTVLRLWKSVSKE